MAEWKWYAHDLATGALAATPAVESWSHEDRINEAGGFDLDLASVGRLEDVAAVQATLAARSTITPIRDGQPVGQVGGYCGVVWAPDPPSISGASLLSYFDDQSLNATKEYAQVDQHYLLKDLVDWVQANDGNIQIDTSQVEASTILRDQTWYVWEQKNIGEAFRQKSDNLSGFDFDFRVEMVAGRLTRRLRLWTPRRGRPYQPQASPVFKVGSNVLSVPSAPANGGDMVTHVYAVGAESGVVTTVGDSEVRHRLVVESVRTDLLTAGYPRLSVTLDRNDVKDLATLQAHADGYAAYNGAAAIDEIVLEVDPDDATWPWGSWDLGDDCLVIIPEPVQESHSVVTDDDIVDADGDGISDVDGTPIGTVTTTITYSTKTTLPWWPNGLREVRRVVAHRWSVDASGEHLEVVTGRPLG